MLHVTDLPTVVRKSCKEQGSFRNALHQATKAEQDGDRSAKDKRGDVVQKMQRQFVAIHKTMHDTKDFGHAAELASLALKTGELRDTNHDLLRKAKACLLFGVQSASLTTTLDHVRDRAAEAVDKAQQRLDANGDSFEATGQLALLTSKLPQVGFKTNHPDVRPIRNKYNNLMNSVRKQR